MSKKKPSSPAPDLAGVKQPPENDEGLQPPVPLEIVPDGESVNPIKMVGVQLPSRAGHMLQALGQTVGGLEGDAIRMAKILEQAKITEYERLPEVHALFHRILNQMLDAQYIYDERLRSEHNRWVGQRGESRIVIPASPGNFGRRS